MNSKNWYALILAGGKGERLWPLSREKRPKQLLPFHNGTSLLEDTIDRINPLIAKERIWIVTTKTLQQQVDKAVGHKVGKILAEPAPRNTGPALIWACMQLAEQNPDAVGIFLPADHFIKEQDLFVNTVKTAATYAQKHDCITLIGLKPDSPATGYGYIEFDKHNARDVYPIKKFHEKPSLKKAKEYVLADNMLWNSGMFCGKASTFIAECQQHAPKLYAQLEAYLNNKIAYKDIEKLSIDYAVMEKSKNICVLPATFSWSDVGNLDLFLSLQGKTQEADDSVYAINAHHNLVHSNHKPIALIGVDNLCIVDTPDALLIAKRDDIEKVKLIVQQLRAAGKIETL